MTDLSKVKFVALGLVHQADLFTKEDLAHLSNCTIEVNPTNIGPEHALIADIKVFFSNLYYLDHKPSTHPVDLMPAEIRFAFLQSPDRKLTGEVEGGFFGEGTALARRLNYIRGW